MFTKPYTCKLYAAVLLNIMYIDSSLETITLVAGDHRLDVHLLDVVVLLLLVDQEEDLVDLEDNNLNKGWILFSLVEQHWQGQL